MATSSPDQTASASLATASLYPPGVAARMPPGSSVAHMNVSHSGFGVGPNTRSRRRRTADEVASAPRPQKRPRTQHKSQKKSPPEAEAHDDDNEKKPAATESCCICMCDVEPEDLAGINSCDHRFCFGCIEKWAERENTCPLCKIRFSKIERVDKKRRKGQKSSKKVKQRDQRSDLVPGAALEGLLANFTSRNPNTPSIARLIFSGMGGNFTLEGPHGGPRFRTSSRSVTFTEAEGILESDEDGESPLSNFIRAFQGQLSGRVMHQVVRPVTLSAHLSRSYASNMDDRSAGNRAENPLEINDDSDDDGSVEVVQVRRPA